MGPKEAAEVFKATYTLFNEWNDAFCTAFDIKQPDLFERVATTRYLDLSGRNLTGKIPGSEFLTVCEGLGNAWDGPMAQFAPWRPGLYRSQGTNTIPLMVRPSGPATFGLLDLRDNLFTGRVPQDLVACCQRYVLQEAESLPHTRCLGIGSGRNFKVRLL